MAVDPTPAQVIALTQAQHAGPVHMINLLQFKPDGGLEGYLQYAAAVQPHLERVGGRVVAMSVTQLSVIGDDERPWWDAIATVEYPSIAAFIQMVTNPEYQAITSLRTNSLVRAELIATAPGSFDA